jgi:hypothetical protein
METKIWEYQRWVNIKPTDTINTTRRLHSFCVFNCLTDSIFKSQGGYYNLTPDGKLEFVGKTLGSISFQEIHTLLTLKQKPKC